MSVMGECLNSVARRKKECWYPWDPRETRSRLAAWFTDQTTPRLWSARDVFSFVGYKGGLDKSQIKMGSAGEPLLTEREIYYQAGQWLGLTLINIIKGNGGFINPPNAGSPVLGAVDEWTPIPPGYVRKHRHWQTFCCCIWTTPSYLWSYTCAWSD